MLQGQQRASASWQRGGCDAKPGPTPAENASDSNRRVPRQEQQTRQGERHVTPDRHSAFSEPEGASAPRFHPPHGAVIEQRPQVAPLVPELLLAVAGKSEAVAADQLQQQAAELSEHLRTRQHSLARWEASLNARSAQQDDQQRNARLWLREQQIELSNRFSEFQRRASLLEERAAALDAVGTTAQTLAREQEEVRQRAVDLTQQQQALDLELENVRRQADWLNAERENWQQQCRREQLSLDRLRQQLMAEHALTEQLNQGLREQLTQGHRNADQSAQLAAQRQELLAQTAQLRQQQETLDQQRCELAQEKKTWHMRTLEQRQSLAARWRRRRRLLQSQLEALQSRRRLVNEQHEAMLCRQEDLDRQQRQIREDRFVLQQVQAQLEQRTTPTHIAALEQAIHQYVEAQSAALEQKLAERKQELRQLAATIQRQQESLQTRHDRLHGVLVQRQSELDEWAARLALREHTLERHEHLALNTSPER